MADNDQQQQANNAVPQPQAEDARRHPIVLTQEMIDSYNLGQVQDMIEQISQREGGLQSEVFRALQNRMFELQDQAAELQRQGGRASTIDTDNDDTEPLLQPPNPANRAVGDRLNTPKPTPKPNTLQWQTRRRLAKI